MGAWGGSNDVIEVINRDCRGARLMQQYANANDAKSIVALFKSILDKYGHDNVKVEIDKAKPKKETEDWVAIDEKFKF